MTQKDHKMVKVVVLLPVPMYEKLHDAKEATGEPVNQIIRACIRIGFPQVVAQIDGGWMPPR